MFLDSQNYDWEQEDSQSNINTLDLDVFNSFKTRLESRYDHTFSDCSNLEILQKFNLLVPNSTSLNNAGFTLFSNQAQHELYCFYIKKMNPIK